MENESRHVFILLRNNKTIVRLLHIVGMYTHWHSLSSFSIECYLPKIQAENNSIFPQNFKKFLFLLKI